MIEVKRKKVPVGREQLETREDAAEYRSTGKNARKDQCPETGSPTDWLLLLYKTAKTVRIATGEKEKSVLLPGIKKPGPMSTKIKSTAVDFGKVYEAMMGRAPNAVTESLFSEQNFS